MIVCDLCKKNIPKGFMKEFNCCEKSKNSKRCLECYDKTMKDKDKFRCNFCNEFIIARNYYNVVRISSGIEWWI